MTPQIGERVVADVRHEIGNYFHKLYYWADFLTESRNGHTGDLTATQMLEETIRGLENLLRATLEYVRPLTAVPVRMQAHEVTEGLVRQLVAGLDGRRVVTVLDDGVPRDRVLLLDPGRLSQLVTALAHRLAAATDGGGTLEIRATAEGRGSAEVLAIRMSGAPTGLVQSTLAEVEWATAQNVARVVGGELAVQEAADRTTFTLVFPLRS
jgi:signal transduction histidine kinase